MIRFKLIFIILFFSTNIWAQKTVSDYIESGNQKEELNDFKGAFTDLSMALLLEPNNSKVLYYLGFVKKYHLVATGGSDFHGFIPDRPDNFGWTIIPPEHNECFRERLVLCAQ